MKRKIVYSAKIKKEEGKTFLTSKDKKSVQEVLDSWSDGSDLRITIEKLSAKATHNQFEWLYGVVYEEVLDYFQNVQGYEDIDIDDVDIFFKRKFLTVKKYDAINNVTYEEFKNKRNLTTVELKEFIEKIILFCAENFHITISTPEDMLGVQ